MGCCCARGRGAAADDGLPFLSGDGGINIYHSEADAASLTSLTPRVQRVRAIEDYGDRITVTVDVASQQPPRLSTPASAVSPLAGETEHVRLSIAIDDLPAFPRDGSFVSCVSMDTVETSPLGSPSAAPACTASPLHQGSEEAASGLLYSAAEISDQLATPGMTPGLSPALGLGETASAGPRSQLAGPPSGLQGSGRVAALPRPRGASTKLTCPPPQWLVSGHESVTVTDHRGHKRQVGLHFTGHSIEVSVDGFRILATRHFRKLADTALGREHRPHAEWKSCYEDKQGTRAWTRPAPSTPWLATADGVPYNDAVNQVRVCGEFHCPASLLYDVLHDSEYRSQWDANMIEGRRITELTPRSDVGYYSAKFPSPLSNRDFCNQRSWVEFRDGSFAILSLSVRHADCPEKPGITRAFSFGGGYYVSPREGGGCRLWYASHSDMRSSVPPWVVNMKLGKLSAGMIANLRKAVSEYPHWLQTRWEQGVGRDPSRPAPWRTPPQDSWADYDRRIETITSSEAMGRAERVDAERRARAAIEGLAAQGRASFAAAAAIAEAS